MARRWPGSRRQHRAGHHRAHVRAHRHADGCRARTTNATVRTRGVMPDRRLRFSNPWPTQPPSGHNNVLRWALAHRLRRVPDSRDYGVEIATPTFERPNASADDITVTWIGHST